MAVTKEMKSPALVTDYLLAFKFSLVLVQGEKVKRDEQQREGFWISVSLLITATPRHRSHLHLDGLQGVVVASVRVPDDLDILVADGAMRCEHAVGIRPVAIIVPESSQEVLSAVFLPNIVVVVECRELHAVEICQTVPLKWEKQTLVDFAA